MWVALDAEFYLAVDAGHEGCLGLLDDLGHSGKLLLPTAYQEIADHCTNTQDQELQEHALDAITFMAANGVLAAPHPAENVGIDDGLASQLITEGLLKPDQRNQALILAECACAQVSFLLTLDPEILAIDQDLLRKIISEKDLQPFEIRGVSTTNE